MKAWGYIFYFGDYSAVLENKILLAKGILIISVRRINNEVVIMFVL